MKHIAGMLFLLAPMLVSAQTWTPCGSSSTPCVINAQISGTPAALTLVNPAQENVLTPPGVEIQWNVTGAAWFLVVLDYHSTLFGGKNQIFFKGPVQGGTTGATVVNQTSANGVHYFLYAVDANGDKYILDPKIITTSNTRKGKPADRDGRKR